MKVKLALAVATLQVLVLAFMAGQRELVLRNGTPLVLRTAPLDPNDPMRGAYVRLNYEISHVPAAQCVGKVANWVKSTDYREMQRVRDRVVYAWLQKDAYGVAELVSLSDQPPEHDGVPFIKGRVQSADTSGVQVRYGIEAQFMSKQAAQRTEKEGFEKVGAPMNVTVAVGSNGTAVLKDATWEPLGITLAFDRQPPRDQNDPQRWQPRPLTGVTVTLHNYGDKDVAIVDLPGGQSFNLLQNTRFQGTHYRWVGRERTATPNEAHIIVLKPGAKHEVHLNLTQPQWWIVDTAKQGAEPMPFQKIPQTDVWNASFRIEYAPPTADAVRGLRNANLIRHAPLRTRAFNANQGVD